MPDPRAVGPWLFIYGTLRCLIVPQALLALDYNYLFLPSKVINADTNIVYIYDAIGTKLKKQFTSGSNITNHYYAGMFEYDNNRSLNLIHTDEGMVSVTSVNDTARYSYEYYLKDHLGNVRVVFNSDTLLQVNDYYPFGMISFISSNGSDNKYLYNGKELQKELGLEWYDYGARFYDPQIGRFFTLDPLQEKYYFQTPFAYASNNPIIYIDFYGNGPWDIVKGVGLMVGGVIQFGVGIAITAASAPTGVGPVAGVAIMTNSVCNIGWGIALVVDNGKSNLPEGNVQAIGRVVDEKTNNTNHTYEKMGTTADFAAGSFGGGKEVTGVVKTLEQATSIIAASSSIETIIGLSNDKVSTENKDTQAKTDSNESCTQNNASATNNTSNEQVKSSSQTTDKPEPPHKFDTLSNSF